MAKPKSKSKVKARDPYALHAKRRKAGVHQDKRKTAKAKQKEEEAILNEDSETSDQFFDKFDLVHE